MRLVCFIGLLGLSIFCFAQKATKGILDLSDIDLTDSFVSLAGQWEFYQGDLIDPDSLDNYSKDYYNFPSLWNGGKTENGYKVPSQGAATYRLKVVLPPKTPPLAISVNEMYNAYTLYYNGFVFAKNGKVGETKETSEPDWLPQTLTAGRFSDTLEFVLHVSNFRHTKGGTREPISIGDSKLLLAKRDYDLSYDFLLCGSLIMGGLFFLGLYLFGQHEKSVLLFALFCITFSYRMVGSGEYALHALYPNMSWQFLIRSEYLFLFIPPGIFTYYSYLLYPKDSKKRILLGFSGVCTLFSVLSLITPTIFFTQLVEPFLILMVVTIFYLFYVYWIAYKRKRIGASYALASTAMVFFVAGYLIIEYLTLFEENTAITFIGFILFFFFQSLILSFRFAYSLKKAKEAAETASQAKTEFLSTISHEIRTPLNAVVGISHYLINEKPRRDQIQSLQSLRFSAEHLTILINDILDYNKLESGNIELELAEVDLKELSEKIIKTHEAMAHEKAIELHLEYDENIHPVVEADSTRIYQVLNNLINNAIKFTPRGRITLRIKCVAQDDRKQRILVEVEDTGIGIPDDKLVQIFDRFTQAGSSTTREFGGTGLGLAIIKKILHLANSEIYVKSKVGEGTTFWFELNFKKIIGKKSLQNTYMDDDDSILENKRILLVEDNTMNIMVAEKFLKKWNLIVEVAHNGSEAVDMVRNNSYDLILMDLQMPVMDGYKATRRIRMFNRDIPILALTASALLNVRQDVLNAGMNDYITKPFDPTQLNRKIKTQIIQKAS